MRVVEQRSGGVVAEAGDSLDASELGHEPAEKVPVLPGPGDLATRALQVMPSAM